MNFARSPWLIPLLLVLVILLFGANKLPGLARNMGESMRIFKSEVSEMRKDDEKHDNNASSASSQAREAERPAATREERSYDSRDGEQSSEELYRRD